MSGLIDLKKSAGIVLEKRSISTDIVAKVGLAVDISGSMQNLYNSGAVQTAVDRVLALGGIFDDDESIDMWMFTTRSQQLESVTPADFGGYLQNKGLPECNIKWGGTAYHPILSDIVSFYYGAPQTKEKKGLFGKLFSGKNKVSNIPEGREDENDTYPAFIAFITDGDTMANDKSSVKKLMNEIKDKNIFIQFIGIGGYHSDFLANMADTHTNAGYFDIGQSMSDIDLFDSLLSDKVASFFSSNG